MFAPVENAFRLTSRTASNNCTRAPAQTHLSIGAAGVQLPRLRAPLAAHCRSIWMPGVPTRAHRSACLGPDRCLATKNIGGGTAAATGEPRSKSPSEQDPDQETVEQRFADIGFDQ